MAEALPSTTSTSTATPPATSCSSRWSARRVRQELPRATERDADSGVGRRAPREPGAERETRRRARSRAGLEVRRTADAEGDSTAHARPTTRPERPAERRGRYRILRPHGNRDNPMMKPVNSAAATHIGHNEAGLHVTR